MRVFICNLMTQANESLGLTASEHIERIYEHTRAPIFDYAIVNTAPFSAETLARYAAEGAAPIEPISSASRRWACGASPATLPAKKMWFATANRVTDALLELGQSAASAGEFVTQHRREHQSPERHFRKCKVAANLLRNSAPNYSVEFRDRLSLVPSPHPLKRPYPRHHSRWWRGAKML